MKRKRAQVKVACLNCRKKHYGCDSSRPCKRCVQYGIGDTCSDEPPKRQKKYSNCFPDLKTNQFTRISNINPHSKPWDNVPFVLTSNPEVDTITLNTETIYGSEKMTLTKFSSFNTDKEPTHQTPKSLVNEEINQRKSSAFETIRKGHSLDGPHAFTPIVKLMNAEYSIFNYESYYDRSQEIPKRNGHTPTLANHKNGKVPITFDQPFTYRLNVFHESNQTNEFSGTENERSEIKNSRFYELNGHSEETNRHSKLTNSHRTNGNSETNGHSRTKGYPRINHPKTTNGNSESNGHSRTNHSKTKNGNSEINGYSRTNGHSEETNNHSKVRNVRSETKIYSDNTNGQVTSNRELETKHTLSRISVSMIIDDVKDEELSKHWIKNEWDLLFKNSN